MMKKLLLLFVALLQINCVMAKNDVDFIGGDGSIMQQDITIGLKFDYSKTVLTGTKKIKGKTLYQYLKDHGQDWLDDFEKEQMYVGEDFAKNINRKNAKKGFLQVDPHAKNPQYVMILTIDQFDPGSTMATIANQIVGFGIKTGGAIIWGRADIVEVATGKKMASWRINELKSEGTYSETERLSNVIWDVARKMRRMFDKEKKLVKKDYAAGDELYTGNALKIDEIALSEMNHPELCK